MKWISWNENFMKWESTPVSKSKEHVIQSLNTLISFKEDFLSNLPKQKDISNKKLTDAFQALHYGSFNFINDSLFLDLIKDYNEYAQNIRDALLNDPYHFLKYFLIFLNGKIIMQKMFLFFNFMSNKKRMLVIILIIVISLFIWNSKLL